MRCIPGWFLQAPHGAFVTISLLVVCDVSVVEVEPGVHQNPTRCHTKYEIKQDESAKDTPRYLHSL